MSSEQIAPTYLPDPLVAKRYNVSPRTIARWDETPDLGFPPPTYIRGRKYREVERLQKFERERAARAGQDTRARRRRVHQASTQV
jgi:hypothetical protein